MHIEDSIDPELEGAAEINERDIPGQLPVMAVRDVVVFNYMILPLFVGRPSSVGAVNEAMSRDKLIMLVAQKDAGVDDPGTKDIYHTGMVCMVMRTLKLPDGRLKVLVQAVNKARITAFAQENPYLLADIELLHDDEVGEIGVEVEALMRNVREQTEKILALKGIMSSDLMVVLNNVEEPGRLADLVVSNLQLKVVESQAVLELLDPVARLRKVAEYLQKELEVSTVQARIQSEAKEEMGRSQREYFLREQLQALKKELGDVDERSQELEELRERFNKGSFPKEVKKEGLKQLKRLETMHPDASEASIVRTYLDWLLDVPWRKSSKDRLDLKVAHEVLDADHYGLEKVKERILEYLAVRKLNKASKGPILCFVGPPGVGKTSLGQSIARALGRKFHRISLGGMRDEAEIRGHRRTYIGAMPGRIIQGLKTVESNNPVFMMDEIDKVGTDYRGDPSSALLEVLDPAQNTEFSDHYLNLPCDLSKVMFITTANMTDTIPAALLDRMEVIRLAGYTHEEKVEIAKRYLIPRQIKENGLKPSQVKFAEAAISRLITHYTREAGLRNLEREIGALCRKVARKIAEGGKGPYSISTRTLHGYLGPARYLPEAESEMIDRPGISTGLAWTEVGGEILYVEVSLMKGRGNLTLTGQLGEVMKESAQAALSYCRSRRKELKLEENYFDDLDIHIHVPAGAIPKDGPSAGVTMATALYSALSGKTVRPDVAMTGEITLRGRVLPIGGLKEKALAALRAGITTVVIPHHNKKDLEEIPKDLREKLTFVPVKNMEQILKMIFR
ncbi:endopeptidase La [Desulfurivibrio alkaliphilus]|uniref:Lon protease n=1 Tax=Desulfurivibrio alkaliphilus (strain DSM 19089 / UNIQEM U267 / AHT2) TaxID=589865 RepID=D6Z6E6_DESAT|nr:endopeptidase La [Desulfurivibrio alkaliphilus]ADH86911.1 ATP-dependent protease La [Desulfurivibrio alkaliphilus AHT 2]